MRRPAALAVVLAAIAGTADAQFLNPPAAAGPTLGNRPGGPTMGDPVPTPHSAPPERPPALQPPPKEAPIVLPSAGGNVVTPGARPPSLSIPPPSQ